MHDITLFNAPPPLLQADNLYYKLGQKTIINDISLSLNTGKITAIIGPNGAGKSTLLRLLTGYITPTVGTISLLNQPISQWSANPLSKIRAVMRQQSLSSSGFHVKEIIAMGRAPYGQLHFQQAIDIVMQQTNCHSLGERLLSTLSGGEQQRVQLARALAQLWQPTPTPCCLFLDEPTSALDLYHQQQCLRLIYKLSREQPITICCVLHDLNLASLYADKICLLHQGKKIIEGSANEVLQTELLRHWYQADLSVTQHPYNNCPWVTLNR